MADVADRLRALADAATPGPWRARFETRDDPGQDWHGEEYTQGIDLGAGDYIETDGGHYGPRPENARLIALAPALARGYADALDALAYVDNWRDRVGIKSPNEIRADAARLLGKDTP